MIGHASTRGRAHSDGQSWIAAGLSFLVGLPEDVGARRLLLMVQAYLDESGSAGQSPALILAGWIGSTDLWVEFSKDWRSFLEAQPTVEYFRMQEAASRTGQFERIPEEFRNKKFRDLSALLRKHGPRLIFCVIDLEAFDESLAKAYERPFSNPKFWAIHHAVMGIAYDLAQQGHAEEVEIVFDEDSSMHRQISIWYPLIRASMTDAAIRRIMPVSPIFRDDKKVVPLQAADFIAWLIHRGLSTGDNRFPWLVEELEEFVVLSVGSQAVDRERLDSILEGAYRQALESGMLDDYENLDDEGWPKP